MKERDKLIASYGRCLLEIAWAKSSGDHYMLV